MVLAFTPRPIRHPFAPTKPLGPNSSRLGQIPPPLRITRPSAELQPTCWIQGQLGFRCHNKNHSGPLMIVWLWGRRLFHTFSLSFRLSFEQSFFISFAFNFFAVPSFLSTPLLSLMFWGAEGRASVIWKILRDM